MRYRGKKVRQDFVVNFIYSWMPWHTNQNNKTMTKLHCICTKQGKNMQNIKSQY
jgi:hypothetical protein